MAALAGAWAREVAADAWPGPVNEGAPRATRLFVAGGATHAGKSTVCLGILQAALEKYGLSDQVSYISTGGGAFLEFLEGKTLPAVAMLESRAVA